MSNEIKAFRTGQSVLCRVDAPDVGGYLVTVSPGAIQGFLPSQDPLEIGKQIPATYVCMSGDRALLTFAYMIGTTERVQFSTASDSVNAFSVWADSYPSNMRLRRAIDIFMPPVDGNVRETDTSETNLRALAKQLSESKFTGCLKAQSEQTLSRCAALLYQGRVVGCLYGTKGARTDNEPYPTQTSMNMMISDLRLAGTQMQLYTLPDEIVLSMSSLFLGCPIENLHELYTPDAVVTLLRELSERKDTACVMLTSAEPAVTISISFVYEGRYVGTFLVEKQQYLPASELPLHLPAEFERARLDASFLPKVMTSQSIQYGYVLEPVIANLKDLTL